MAKGRYDNKSVRARSLLSARDIEHLRGTLGDTHSYLKSMRDPQSVMMGEKSTGSAVLANGEVLGAALLNGYLSSRYNAFHPGGTRIPLDAVGSLVALALAYYNKVPAPDHVARTAIGFLSGYAFKLGAGFGTQGRLDKGLQPIAVVAGCMCEMKRPKALPPASSNMLTEAEMAAISRSY